MGLIPPFIPYERGLSRSISPKWPVFRRQGEPRGDLSFVPIKALFKSAHQAALRVRRRALDWGALGIEAATVLNGSDL
jgi:hypothetical protein